MSRLHYVKLLVTVSGAVTPRDNLYVGRYEVVVQKNPDSIMAGAAKDMVLSRLPFECPDFVGVAVYTDDGTLIKVIDPNVSEMAGGLHRAMHRL